MGTGEIRAVPDSGPLIHLAEINCLPLLSIFGSLHIPEAVWSETIERGRTPKVDFSKLANIKRHNLNQTEITRFVENSNLKGLHAGERECLYLCKQIGIQILLTDDLAVREAAKRLNLIPVGSLGIVAKAYRLGHISQVYAEQHIIDLYDVSSLFVTKSIVELAIEQLRKYAGHGK